VLFCGHERTQGSQRDFFARLGMTKLRMGRKGMPM